MEHQGLEGAESASEMKEAETTERQMDEDVQEDEDDQREGEGDEEADPNDSQDINPYAYLDRNEFTTECFKIEISHPKHFGTSVSTVLSFEG